MSQAPTVFICYDREDCESQDPQQHWLDRLSQYLQPYQRQDKLKLWSSRDILPGAQRRETVLKALDRAEAAVLLVGPGFLASDRIYSEEMPLILQGAKSDRLTLIPIVVRGCLFNDAVFKYRDDRGTEHRVSLASFETANLDDRPLNTLSEAEQNEVFSRVARTLAQLAERRPAARATPPPENPFQPLVGKIEDPSLVFGREREIDLVFEILNSGSSVALIGDREVGKSSLLSAIAALAEARLQLPRRPVYLHLQHVESEADFYREFCHLAGIEECRGFQLRRSLERLRLLLLLDEVEQVQGDGFTSQVRGWLRGSAEGGDAPLRLVVAGCVPLDRLFPDSIGMVSPLQGICLEVPLNPWDEDRARSFVLARLAGTGVRFGEEQLGRMVRESRGYPKRLVRSAYELFRELTLNQ